MPSTVTSGDAKWALALAITSIFICAPVAAPLAIVRARRALTVGASKTATAAIILAAIGLALSALLWAMALWQFLDPS